MSILFQINNNVASICLNRPEKYNSINRELAFSFQDALDQCASDESIRAVVITGQGKAFCAGQDLAEVVDPSGPPISKIVSTYYNPLILKIRNLQKPVVAAVNGVAAGAGASIALACDVVIASDTASFIQAFSKIGLIPDSGGTYFLPRLIGMQRASALMMLGDKISAQDALQMGMLYKVVPQDQLGDEAQIIADTLAHMPTKALWLTKKLLNDTYTNDLNAQLMLEDSSQAEAADSHDYKEGVSAFVEKRKPTFVGK